MMRFFSRPSRALANVSPNLGRRFACPGLLSCSPPALEFLAKYHAPIERTPRSCVKAANHMREPRDSSRAHAPEGPKESSRGQAQRPPGQPREHEEPWRSERKSCDSRVTASPEAIHSYSSSKRHSGKSRYSNDECRLMNIEAGNFARSGTRYRHSFDHDLTVFECGLYT
jgi:hypothetical protein